MLYYTKTTDRILKPAAFQEVDVEYRTTPFRFLARIDAKNQDILQKMLEADLPKNPKDAAKAKEERLWMLAGIVAASATSLHAESLAPPALIEAALRYLRDLLSATGYEEWAPVTLQSALQDDTTHKLVVVVGCQTPELLESRVKRAHVLTQVLKSPTLVLSGRCPKRKKVRIPNESERMAEQFERLGEAKTVEVHKLILENKSENTAANVDEILHHPDVFTRKGKYTVFLITSTFHLQRLAQCYEEVLRKSADVAPRIARTVFTYSEEPDACDRLVAMPEYVRATMLEAYAQVLRTSLPAFAKTSSLGRAK